jgi:hypothetical protein
MLITDAAGGYVDPRTGASRFGVLNDEDQGSDVVPTYTEEAAKDRPRWDWPTDARRDVRIAEAREPFVGRSIVGVYSDHLGWRLVIDRGDRPEPGVYVDLHDPERRDRHGSIIDTHTPEAEIPGMAIAKMELETGVIELILSDRSTLRSSADENYESWQLVAGDRGLWVCLPGGDLAAFPFSRSAAAE